MALFKINEKPKEQLAKFHHETNNATKFINEHIYGDIESQMGELRMGETIHFATDAKWHLHDLIVWVLSKTGPADLYFCTYAIKEFQARLFSNMKSDGTIKQTIGLLDYRASVHDPNVVQLLEGFADKLGKTRTHAKLTVICNEHWGVTIAGSANLTKNTRADIGVITCDKAVAQFRKEWILHQLK
jgi:hypothetical protein